jgi:hypothetical protein
MVPGCLAGRLCAMLRPSEEESTMTAFSIRFAGVRRALGAMTVLALGANVARADVAATGDFGIDISVNLITQTGTFDGQITAFDAGPFSVGGTPVDLASGVGTMTIANGNIPSFNIPALAANFNFDAVSGPLSFEGAGIAVCSSNIINCAAGQATFVGDITNLVDGSDLLPDGYVYTFDGTGGDNPGSGFDAIGNFGINGFLPVDVPAGNPVTAASDPTTFYDSRSNVLRDFLIDVSFAEVSRCSRTCPSSSTSSLAVAWRSPRPSTCASPTTTSLPRMASSTVPAWR